MYRMEVGRFPESLEELVNPPPNAQGTRDEPYLEKMPIDPWNHPYVFTIEDGRPVIICVGPDGQEGTQDDISNVQQQTGLDQGL